MKKSLFMLLCVCTCLLVSCDDSNSPSTAEAISKVYREPYLSMTLNESQLSGTSVLLKTSDLITADVSLYNVVAGEDTLIFKSVTLEPMLGVNGYQFTGSSSNSDRNISFTGVYYLDEEVMQMDVTHEISSALVGDWKFDYPYTISGRELLYSSLFDVEPSDPDDLINMYGFSDYELVDYDTFSDLFGSLMSAVASSMILELSADFEQNGYASFACETGVLGGMFGLDVSVESPTGMVRYNVNENKAYLSIAIDKILGGLNISDLTSSDLVSEAGLSFNEILLLVNLAQDVYKGLPMDVEYEDENKVNLYLDRAVLLPYVDLILKLGQPYLSGLDLGTMGAMFGITDEFLTNFPAELVRVMKESKSFKIVFRLAK